MKIARIDTHSVKVPYTFGGSHKGEGLRTWTTNNILLVRVETDFAESYDENFLRHTLVTWEDGAPRLDWKPVTMTKWQPEERKY
mgnify:CR=1 FL=1